MPQSVVDWAEKRFTVQVRVQTNFGRCSGNGVVQGHAQSTTGTIEQGTEPLNRTLEELAPHSRLSLAAGVGSASSSCDQSGKKKKDERFSKAMLGDCLTPVVYYLV